MTDATVLDGGSVVLVEPRSPRARVWVDQHVSREGFQPYWPTVVCEARFAPDLVEGMLKDGLRVEGRRI